MNLDLHLCTFIDLHDHRNINQVLFQCLIFSCRYKIPKTEEFPDIEKWEEMEPDEAAKWAVGSELPRDFAGTDGSNVAGASETPVGSSTGTVKGTGWPGQSTRFLHVSMCHQRFRFVHDSVVARLSPEDIKKAREAKQNIARPVRQKVRKMKHLNTNV